MKKSHRYFRGTFLTLAVSVVVMVAANRVYTPAASAYVPARMPAAALVALRDFTSIRAEGDFALEVQQQSAFAVDYAAISEKHGEFRARVEGNTLVLGGYGNRSQDGIATVRVGLPVLQRLSVNALSTLLVSNVSTGGAELRIITARTVKLLNNSAPMKVTANGVMEVELDTKSAANTTLHLIGDFTVRHLPE